MARTLTRDTARRRVAKRPQDRRDDLLGAAERVFVRKGVGAATVADVTAAAGVAKGTFYLYFDSKDELLAALWERRYVEGFVSHATTLLADGGTRDWWELAQTLIETLVDYDLERRDLHRLLYEAATSEALQLIRAANEQVVELVLDGIDGGVRDGAFHARDPRLTGRLVFYAADAILHDVILHDLDLSRDEIVASIGELFRKAFAATTR